MKFLRLTVRCLQSRARVIFGASAIIFCSAAMP